MKQLVTGVVLSALAGTGLIYFALSLNDRIADRNRREACAVLIPSRELALANRVAEDREKCRASHILGLRM